jgi:translation initiation factor 2B subunit (eIF-2B alpha/beta/delta family)
LRSTVILSGASSSGARQATYRPNAHGKDSQRKGIGITLDALGLDIRLLESRPLYEGVSFASTLLSRFQSHSKTSPVKITLYPDAAAALASGVDVLLLGADRIAASGAVSNKTGSLPATLSVRHISPVAKVVVLSEPEKVTEPGQTGLHVVEENDLTEVMAARKSPRSRYYPGGASGAWFDG